MKYNWPNRVLTIFILLGMLPAASVKETAAQVAALNASSSFSQFSPPQNLGAVINAAEMDQLPVLAPSGLSLYFSSNRGGGQGAQDIWVSQRATLEFGMGTATESWSHDQYIHERYHRKLIARRARNVYTEHSYGRHGRVRYLYFDPDGPGQ